VKWLFVILGVCAFCGAASAGWTPAQRREYSERHFIALEQSLTSEGRLKAADEIAEQETDLQGCREISHGRAALNALISCMKFFDREQQLKIISPGRKQLVDDLNLICIKNTHDQNSLRKLVNSRALSESRFWSSCSNAAWEQIFLTAYANFDADLAGVLALVRLADRRLPGNKRFQGKIRRLLHIQ
jgi:hypothetical protein